MKKHLLFTLLLLISLGLLVGQTWIRYYPFGDLCPGPSDNASSEVCNVIPAIGGGYLLQGYVEFVYGDIPAYANNVFWKLDENGDIVWRRTGGGNFAFNSMVSNGIDRYYCLRYDDMFVFDSEMNMIAQYIFPIVNGFSASLYDMQYVDDGLVFAGRIGNQAVVLKTDFQFNVIWQSDPFWTMSQARSVEPFGNGWVSLSMRVFTEINAVGDTLWTYYDPVDYTSFWDCTVATDNSIYLLGFYKLWEIDTTEHNLQLIADYLPAFDMNGSIDMLPNGNIVYTGSSSSYTGPILHCYSPDGIHQWSRSYNTFGAIYFGTGSKNLLVMPDGSILFPMHHGTIVLVKTDSEGNVVANDDPIAPVSVASIICYPQPASNNVTISVKSDRIGNLGYSIFNIRGQRVYSGKIDDFNKEQSFELPNEALDRMTSGVYLISLDQGKSKIATTKLVVVK
ncbi:MAG: T9SS type A sorting domain-containing protein [Candidatus Cloacimonetes bacterium]